MRTEKTKERKERVHRLGKVRKILLGEKTKLLGGWCKAMPLREIEGREDT